MPIFHFPKDRSVKLTVEQRADVILHCKQPSQDAEFAKKYGVTMHCIRNYRLGRTGYELRLKLKTGWRP